MPYKQGEIVLVPFPFTDLSTTKRRPGLVVSANWYNREESNCILVPITSTVHDPLARYEILVQGIEVKRAGLLYDSVIRAGHPYHNRANPYYQIPRSSHLETTGKCG